MTDQAVEQSSPESRLMALLDAEEVPQGEEQQEQDSPPETQEAETSTEPEAEAQPEPRKLRLKWNDQEIEKDENEVISLAQQGFDYTTKTQRLAEERKQVESQAQAVKAQEQQIQEQAKLQSALIKDYAKVTNIDEQLAQYDGVNWGQLSQQDPSQAQTLFFQYTQLRDKRNQLAQELGQKQTQLHQQHQSRYQEMLVKGQEQLQRDIPGWGPDKASEVREFAKSLGYTEAEMNQIVDPRVVKALYKASQLEKLNQSKPSVESKVANKPPVVKPGSRDPKASVNSQITQVRVALKKTGRSEHAAKLIESMLK